jgi:hypothetical protein
MDGQRFVPAMIRCAKRVRNTASQRFTLSMICRNVGQSQIEFTKTKLIA